MRKRHFGLLTPPLFDWQFEKLNTLDQGWLSYTPLGRWLRNFESFNEYVSQYKTALPSDHPNYRWYVEQKALYECGKMPQARRERFQKVLEKIQYTPSFAQGLALLREFREFVVGGRKINEDDIKKANAQGETESESESEETPPEGNSVKPRQMQQKFIDVNAIAKAKTFLKNVKAALRNGKLNEAQIKVLTEEGFIDEMTKERKERISKAELMQMIQDCYNAYGTICVSQSFLFGGVYRLGKKLSNIKTQYKTGKYHDEEVIGLMLSLGYVF